MKLVLKDQKTSLCSTVNDTSNTLDDFAYEKAYYNMNKTINPAVWDFTSVYVRYCDVSRNNSASTI